MTTFQKALLVVGSLGIVIIGIWWVNIPEPSVRRAPDPTPGSSQIASTYVDQLCVEVERLGLKCPRLMGAPSILEGGAIVQLARLDETPPERVSIPSSWLLRSPCLLPGVTPPKAPEPARNTVTIPTSSYRFEGGLIAGTELRIPKFEGFQIVAGPKVGRVRRVDVSAANGWLLTLGEDAFAQLLSDCRLSESCVARIKQNQDRVVNNVLVAEGVSYTFYDESGRKLSMDAALKDQLFKLGGNASTTKVEETRLVAQLPVVIGVTLMRDNVISQVLPCEKTVIYAVDGRSTVTLSGGGGEGRIPPQPVVTTGLDQLAESRARGSEASECSAGFERAVSTGNLTGITERASEEGLLRFRGEFRLGGGHYATFAQCLAGQPIGRTGHDTSVNGTIQWQGGISILLRRELATTLVVSWSDMPAGAVASVTGPTGQVIAQDFQIAAAGDRQIQVSSPGMYQVRATLTLSRVVNGATTQTATVNGSIRATLASQGRGATVARSLDGPAGL